MTAEGPPPVGSAGLNPSGRALVADSVLGMGMIAAATCMTRHLRNTAWGPPYP